MLSVKRCMRERQKNYIFGWQMKINNKLKVHMHIFRRKTMINLDRFISAQETAYQIALQEVKNGRKQSHWMWFIFPQAEGLGYSPAAQYYAIHTIDEARAYAEHPVLGPRLMEIATVILSLESENISRVFRSPDDLKLLSSLTLFLLVTSKKLFKDILDKYYDGKMCEYTANWVNEQKK